VTARRLLVVDDEVDFSVSVQGVAERLGFEVEVTTHASEFKVIYRRFDPTVVLIDMIMPDVDGIELVRWVATTKCTADIVVASGYSPVYTAAAAAIGTSHGLSRLRRLTKPASLASLTEALLGPGAAASSDKVPVTLHVNSTLAEQ
jgi:DNA-binding NtrC family response regulator